MAHDRCETAGHRALRRWMGERTRGSVAADLGCTAAAVTQWITLLSVPDTVSRIILQEIAGIAPEAWLTGSERERLRAARARARASSSAA